MTNTPLDLFENLPPLLTRRQVAVIAGVHTNTVQNWEIAGLLTPLGPGGRVRYHSTEVKQLLTKPRQLKESQ